jgi:hypothetical protein
MYLFGLSVTHNEFMVLLGTLLQNILGFRISPLPIRATLRNMPLCHLVRRPNIESVQPSQPHLARWCDKKKRHVTRPNPFHGI